MVAEDGVLLDVSNAGEEAFRRIVEFASGAQGLLWSSPFGDSVDGGGGGGGGGGGWSARKKLMVVAPRTVDAVTSFVESIMWHGIALFHFLLGQSRM